MGALPRVHERGPLRQAKVIFNDYMPPGYFAVTASYGKNSPLNPIGFREHPNAKGLHLIPGSYANYPIIDAFARRGIGVGVRHRGAAAVRQIGLARPMSRRRSNCRDDPKRLPWLRSPARGVRPEFGCA